MMQNEEVVREWIEKADEDFGFASSSLENGNYFAQICFHFQQASEKYLKAFIIGNELEFRPIHNLIELFEICREKEPNIEEIEEDCRYLNPFYIDTRYPVHWPTHYDKKTAIKAKNSAAEIRKWVRGFFNF
ncbi:MAG: HEPN domain-containing protein [Candidatus Edwardsbacteria bacterium]